MTRIFVRQEIADRKMNGTEAALTHLPVNDFPVVRFSCGRAARWVPVPFGFR
jgi:hypothetical protein